MSREGVVSHLIEDLYFWSQQLSEHALFLSLGLVKGNYGRSAALFHDSWETLRGTQLRSVPTLAALPGIVAAFRREAQAFHGFQGEVRDALLSGQWLGWLFPGYLDHIMRELEYAVASLDRELSGASRGTRAAREELCTWVPFLKEHAATISHLLDPKEQPVFKDLDTFREKLATLEGQCHADEIATVLGLSRDLGSQFDRYLMGTGIGTGRVKSVVHPLLLDHVHREHQRFLETLQDLESGRVE
jgi:hypothetical protein